LCVAGDANAIEKSLSQIAAVQFVIAAAQFSLAKAFFGLMNSVPLFSILSI